MTTSRSRGETVAVRAFAAVLLALPLPAFAQARTGTGRIAGHVVAAGQQPTPARRAIVSLGGGNAAGRRSVVTGDDGAFVFDGLPPGRFTITASKPAFLAASYGATRPGRPGTAISIAAGQAVDDVVITLVRGAVITGTVRDRNGEPVPRAPMAVVAMDAPDRDPMRPPAITSDILTDDRGVYRAYGLEPGAYLVAAATPGGGLAAQPMDVLSSAEMDAAFAEAARSAGRAGPLGAATSAPSTNRQAATAPHRHQYTYSGIFYPGTADPAQATPITVAAGQERGGVDITFTPVPTATIEGVVTSAFGPLPTLRVYLGSPASVPVPGFVRAAPLMTKSPGADGRFTFSGVVPGQYTLTAQARSGGPTMVRTASGFTTTTHVATPEELAAPLLWARVPLTVNGEDISGVALALQPAPRISGRITFDAVAGKPPGKLDGRVELTPLSQQDLAVARPSGGGVGVVGPGIPTVSAPVDEDGTFTFRGVLPGTYVASATVPAARSWWLRSATMDGRDLLDTPLTIAGGESNMSDFVLTFTDRHTDVSGRLQTPAGKPAPDYYVVVFTTDRTMWRSDGRRLAFARPGSDGTFVIRDLPPGDYYLAALTDLDPRDWKRADLLDQVVPASLHVTIPEGGQVVQNLQIAK
jgi:protocatechuate 3,4-dioxygenase beta subunit